MSYDVPTGIKDQVQVTGAQMLKRLRDIVNPPGKKGLWLRKLNDRQLAEVYHRLRMGQKSYHIIKIVQVEWGIMRKSQPASLGRGLLAFKEKVVGELKLEAQRLPKEEGKKFAERTTKKGERSIAKLDSLGRLRWVINVQTERLELLRETEKNANLPLKMTEKTVEVLGNLLDKLIRYEIDLGLRDAKPSELNTSVKRYFDALIRKVDPEGIDAGGSGGNVMVSAANKMLEEVSKDAVLLTINDDGGYSIADPKPSGDADSIS